MAYNDYSMGGYIPGDYETEEDRRKRLLAEQAQAQAQDQESGGITAQRPSLGDLASQYIGRRVDAAQQRLTDAGQIITDPQAAMERRLGVAQQPDAANTEVQSQQVKTYADGSQEEIVKRQMPAPATAPAPVAPTAMPPAPQVATAPAPAPAPAAAPAPQAQTQQAQTTAVVPTAPAVPEGLVAGGGVPERPDIGQVPTPGPAVQVAQAGPVNPAVAPAPVVQQAPAGAPGASLAQAGQVAQATTRPQWAVDLEAAGTDQDKLIDIAANKAYPQDVREDAKAKLRQAQDKDIAAKDAEKTVMAAAQGDPKAQQKLLNSIKPGAVKREEEGKVTEGSYIRAYLYARLGLNDLAQDEQQKILGKSKFGQVTVNGQSFEVETDPRSGRVLLARDAEGNKVDTPILNKIRAEAAKFGTHAYGFTGPSATIPTGQADAGQEYRQRTNTITGDIENIITTGPNRGKLYSGPPGFEKRVETNAAVKLNDAYIDFQTKPTIAMATTMLELAGKADNGKNNAIANAMAEIQRRSPAIFNQIKPLASSITAQGGGGTVTGGGGGGGTVTGGGGGGGGSLLQQTERQKSDINITEEQVKDRNKANQNYSDNLAASRQTAAAQNSTINRLQSAIDKNPNFWGIDTNSPAWRAFVDVNSTNADRGESLNTLARNMNIPKEQRPAFDAVMNDYRSLQVNAITGSGLTASQTNTERESQRVMGTVGAISDRPAAAKATLEYAKAKIEYTDAKSRAWAQARKTNPGIDRLDFETNFDATTGEKIFKDANERMRNILGGPEAAMDVRRQADRILGAP